MKINLSANRTCVKHNKREERKRARQKASKMKAEMELVKKIQQSGVKLIIDDEEIDEFDEKDQDSRESLINGIETLQPNVKVRVRSFYSNLMVPRGRHNGTVSVDLHGYIAYGPEIWKSDPVVKRYIMGCGFE